jgi:2,3-diketo-5-methylthio-1-phosphopentane phosphatase
MRTVYLCDFDGTIAPDDVGAELVRAFSPGRDAERAALLARWKTGTMGHRELTEAEAALLAIDAPQAYAFVARFAIDPGFAPFVSAARARGDQVQVLSEGFGFYVEALLAGAGLGDLPWAANALVFENGGARAEFPNYDPECGRCGNCKGRHAREWRARGWRTVMVGDGLSDRCGARAADAVFARGDLLDWCAEQRLPAEPFAGFHDLSARVRASA